MVPMNCAWFAVFCTNILSSLWLLSLLLLREIGTFLLMNRLMETKINANQTYTHRDICDERMMSLSCCLLCVCRIFEIFRPWKFVKHFQKLISLLFYFFFVIWICTTNAFVWSQHLRKCTVVDGSMESAPGKCAFGIDTISGHRKQFYSQLEFGKYYYFYAYYYCYCCCWCVVSTPDDFRKFPRANITWNRRYNFMYTFSGYMFGHCMTTLCVTATISYLS